MTWARLDDKFPWHPKVIGLSDKAFRVHVGAFCYCAGNLTDGFVPMNALGMLGGTRKLVEELLAGGLWLRCEGGFTIHDFLDYNPSRTDVEAAREQRSNAGRASADARRSQRPVERPVVRDVERVLQRLPNNNPARPVPLTTTTATAAGVREVYDLWTEATGSTLTPMTGDAITGWIDRVGAQWVGDAIRETGRAGVKAWRYTEQILLRWERDGRDTNARRPNPTATGTRRADQAARTGQPHVLDILRANGRLTEELPRELPGATSA